MSSIENISVSVPLNKIDRSNIPDIAERWLSVDPNLREKFQRIASNCGVEKRSLVLPYKEVFEIGGLRNRANIFLEMGEPILTKAVEDCLQNSKYSATDISHLLFSSCTVPLIPSIDAKLIQSMNFSNTVKRLPVFQHGCVGGVVGLSLGSQFAKLGKPVMVTSLELCSLVFQFGNTEGNQLIGASIFADGAAAAIISPEVSSFNFIDSMSYLIPDSTGLMGYDIYDDGFHLRLDRDLPSVLIKEAPKAIDQFLSKHQTKLEDISYLLFHPGGKKILDFFEEKFELRPEQCCWARDILREHGNMSSATIFFVIEKFMRDVKLSPGEKVMVMGIGPGLTLELILLQG